MTPSTTMTGPQGGPGVVHDRGRGGPAGRRPTRAAPAWPARRAGTERARRRASGWPRWPRPRRRARAPATSRHDADAAAGAWPAAPAAVVDCGRPATMTAAPTAAQMRLAGEEVPGRARSASRALTDDADITITRPSRMSTATRRRGPGTSTPVAPSARGGGPRDGCRPRAVGARAARRAPSPAGGRAGGAPRGRASSGRLPIMRRLSRPPADRPGSHGPRATSRTARAKSSPRSP